MGEEVPPEPVRPLRCFIEGAGIPGAIILVCMGIGAVFAVWQRGPDIAAIIEYAKFGAGAGLFLMVIGGWEMVVGLLFEPEPWENKLSRAAGLALVLIPLTYGLFWSFALS